MLKLKRPVRHFLSVAFAPLAAFLPLSHAVGLGIRPVVAQEASQGQDVAIASCFTGVDYSKLSYEELSRLVSETVADLRGTMTDEQLVVEIGRQLGESASECSPAQTSALIRNVTLILTELGIEPTGNVTLAQLVEAGFAPSTASTSVNDDAVVPRTTVY